MLRSSTEIQSGHVAALNCSTLPAAILAAVLGLGIVLILAKPAAAYDDDVEVVCFEYEVGGKSETECQTIAELAAECAVVDPEYSSDVCQGLLEDRVPVGIGLTANKKRHRDINGKASSGVSGGTGLSD